MFTGIVAAIGQIESVTALSPIGSPAGADGLPGPEGASGPVAGRAAAGDGGVRLRIATGALDLTDLAIGDSIAVQGACLTVVALGAAEFSADLSVETLERTCGLDRVGPVNLEKALRLADRLGGHLVSGHVDGIGQVLTLTPAGESLRLELRVPPDLSRLVAPKGSITVDGVSLTVNRVRDETAGSRIEINLIPHTLNMTTLRERRIGDPVNLEVDLIARHVARLIESGASEQAEGRRRVRVADPAGGSR